LVEARLRTAYIRQQSYSPRPYERKHPLPCLTDVFPEVLILLLQPNQGCQRLVIIPLSLVRSFIVVRLHPYERVSHSVNYKRKNVGACICPFCIQAYHSLEENRQRNNHVEVYRYTVKCASEDMVSPRSTLRRVYTTPRGVTPAMFLSSFRCGSSNTQKQSVSNAFP